MTPDEQALKDKLIALLTKMRDACMAEDANPYLVLMVMEKEMEWLRHEIIVAGKR